jgi:hypothetical protein
MTVLRSTSFVLNAQSLFVLAQAILFSVSGLVLFVLRTLLFALQRFCRLRRLPPAICLAQAEGLGIQRAKFGRGPKARPFACFWKTAPALALND